MSLLSATTLLSTLSPLLTYSPCITCAWTEGFIQGWNNTDTWDGTSQRYVEAWAVGTELALETEFQGTSFSLILAPSSSYNISISINDTIQRVLPDLGSSTTINMTQLPEGTHSFKAAFESIDSTRAPNPDQRIRIFGLELGWEGVSVSSKTTDDSEWQAGQTVSYSPGWSLMSSTDLTANVVNTTEAAILTPLLPKFSNESISWTSFNGSSLQMNFTGNFLTLLAPLYPSLGTFLPILDSVAYPQVNLTKNLPDPALDSSLTYGQVAWHIAGLSDGAHVFEMQNVGGEAEGTGGVMMVDNWLSGTVSQQPLSVSASASATSSAAPASSSASAAAAAGTVVTAGTTSTSLGIFIAVGVGGLAALGLIILLAYKLMQRRRARSEPPAVVVSGSGGKPSGGAAGGGLRNKISSPRPFSSSNPSPFRNSTNGAPFQTLTNTNSNPSSRNLLSPSGAAAAPLWAANNSSSKPQMSNVNPSSQLVSFSSAVAVPRSTVEPAGILLRPMSEAGEVGDMYEDAEHEHDQRTSSFAAFAPPPRSVLPFHQSSSEQEEDNRSSYLASPRSIDRERWADEREQEERERERRQTVGTSQSGSVYPGDEEGEGRDSTYSLTESYFALDPGESERRASSGRPLSERTVTPPARGASRVDGALKSYF